MTVSLISIQSLRVQYTVSCSVCFSNRKWMCKAHDCTKHTHYILCLLEEQSFVRNKSSSTKSKNCKVKGKFINYSLWHFLSSNSLTVNWILKNGLPQKKLLSLLYFVILYGNAIQCRTIFICQYYQDINNSISSR